MTTSTLTNTIWLADLINKTGQRPNMAALQVTGQHDGTKLLDGRERLFSDMNGILYEPNGLYYDFPSVFKMRETVEWEEGVVANRETIREAIRQGAVIDGTDGVRAISWHIQEIMELLKTLDSSFDSKMAGDLPFALCSIWSLADAFCLELDGKLWEQGDEQHRLFRGLGVDIYRAGGRILASHVWDFIEIAHKQGVADRLAVDRAKKPMSKAAKKKAAAKKARKR